MSVVHKALKKAESDEQKRAQLKDPASLTKQGELERPPVKRVVIILSVFFVLLIIVSYFPSYYTKRRLKRAKESIKITPPKSKAVKVSEDTALSKEIEEETDEEFQGSAKELNKKGIYFFNTKDYDKAKSYFDAAIKKDKTDHETYNNLGLTLKKKKKYKEAMLTYKKALSLKKNYKECYNNLGVLYDQLGQYDKAVKTLTKAIEIDKNYTEPHFNIATTYEKMKKFKLAVKHYKRYLAFHGGSETDFIKAIKKKVEILKRL